MRGVKQHALVKGQIEVHAVLTQILLCGKTCNTSKGKSMAPEPKLERKLKNVIRNLRLSMDLQNSLNEQEESLFDFDSWFRLSVVSSYVNKIPKTI